MVLKWPWGTLLANNIINIRIGKLWPNKDLTVSLDSAISTLSSSVEVDLETMEGTFEMRMAVYQSEAFETPVGEDFSVSVPDMIYVGVDVEEAAHFVPQLQKCWATPT